MNMALQCNANDPQPVLQKNMASYTRDTVYMFTHILPRPEQTPSITQRESSKKLRSKD